MFNRLKIHHHFSMFTNIVPNYGETCTRQSYYSTVESLYDRCRKHFETFFAKTSVDNYVLFLSNFFLGIFVGQSTDSWLTVFSWP